MKIHSPDIRHLSYDDFDTCYALWESAGLALYPYESEKNRYVAMITLNPLLCLGLFEDNVLIGTILGGFDGRTATINRLALLPDHQKKGNGKLLVSQIETLLLSMGIEKVTVLIHNFNTQVKGFYDKLGYTPVTYAQTFFKDLQKT